MLIVSYEYFINDSVNYNFYVWIFYLESGKQKIIEVDYEEPK